MYLLCCVVLQSSRWYPLMSLLGNLGPIFSGLVMTLASRGVARLQLPAEEAFEQSLKVLSLCMLGAGGVISWLHHFVHSLDSTKNETLASSTADFADSAATTASAPGVAAAPVVTSSSSVVQAERGEAGEGAGGGSRRPQKHSRPKLSFLESVRVLLRDKYLRNVAMMVVSYGLTMEFTEIIWKSTVKKGELEGSACHAAICHVSDWTQSLSINVVVVVVVA